MKKLIFLFGILFTLASSCLAQFNTQSPEQNQWVDSVFQSLTPDQRIAQLIWVNAYANENVESQMKVADLVKKYNLGGVISLPEIRRSRSN